MTPATLAFTENRIYAPKRDVEPACRQMIGQGGSDRHGAIQFNLYRTVTPVGFVQEHIAFAFDNHTGDLARSDKHGFITITGRLKEIIIRGGQNIAPAEVEETIVEIDEVMDCAVVGIPHDTLGEVAYAFIVLHEGKSLTAETVKAHCASSLSVYKIPEEVRIIEQIPRTGSGKIMRFKLRELIDSQTPQ